MAQMWRKMLHHRARHAVMVMEYISGGTLNKQILDAELQWPSTASIRFYAAEMVCALQFLHSRGIIHRDLKADNVLVTNKGHIKIADFGMAVEGIFGERTARGKVGTLPYMAPEVIKDEEYGAGIDWWSLGITIYRMATRSHPFCYVKDRSKCINAILHEEPNIPDWLNKELQDLLRQLLIKDPKKRLGCNGNIREHPFFRSINWENLEKLTVPPPSKPKALLMKDPKKQLDCNGNIREHPFFRSIDWVNLENLNEPPPSKPKAAPQWVWQDNGRASIPVGAASHLWTAGYQVPLSAPFGPFGLSVQPSAAYWPHLYYQQPLPSAPFFSPDNHHPFLGPVIRPQLVPSSRHHNLLFNTPWPFSLHLPL